MVSTLLLSAIEHARFLCGRDCHSWDADAVAINICPGRRLAGHPHVNQNAFPLVLTSLMLREHNRRAQQIEMAQSDWSDEQIYQEARK